MEHFESKKMVLTAFLLLGCTIKSYSFCGNMRVDIVNKTGKSCVVKEYTLEHGLYRWYPTSGAAGGWYGDEHGYVNDKEESSGPKFPPLAINEVIPADATRSTFFQETLNGPSVVYTLTCDDKIGAVRFRTKQDYCVYNTVVPTPTVLLSYQMQAIPSIEYADEFDDGSIVTWVLQ